MWFVVVVALGIIIMVYFSFEENKFENGTTESYASILRKSSGNSGYDFVYEYSCNENKHTYRGIYNHTWIYGDKFKILVDKQDCENVKILVEEPVFIEGEESIESTGIITEEKQDAFLVKPYVVFQYIVNGTNYTRLQYLPNDAKETIDNVVDIKKCKIRYWKENPQRAIIYLSNPINK